VNNLVDVLSQVLCPPGLGVYTIQTGKEKKEKLWQSIYQTNELKTVELKWRESLKHLSQEKPFLLGIASDCGGGIQRGANWGPLAIREFLLSDHQHFDLHDLGDVRVIPHLLHDKYLNQATIDICREALYQTKQTNLPVSPLSMTERALADIYNQFPHAKIMGLGGDHSVSYPLVKTWAENQKKLGKKFAMIHFDAHTDLLESRLGIDLCFGSWTFQTLKYFNQPSDVYQIGIRSSGRDRSHWEKTYGVQQFWAQQVHQSPQNIADLIVQDLLSKGIENLYISFDIDALDEKFAGATGTPENAGLELHQCVSIIKHITQHFTLSGADLVEVAPYVNAGSNKLHEPYTTLLSANSILKVLLEKLC
jgi:agmatinase